MRMKKNASRKTFRKKVLKTDLLLGESQQKERILLEKRVQLWEQFDQPSLHCTKPPANIFLPNKQREFKNTGCDKIQLKSQLRSKALYAQLLPPSGYEKAGMQVNSVLKPCIQIQVRGAWRKVHP